MRAFMYEKEGNRMSDTVQGSAVGMEVETIATVCGGCHNTCPMFVDVRDNHVCLLYTSPSPRDRG